jgi:hypothetical protein
MKDAVFIASGVMPSNSGPNIIHPEEIELNQQLYELMYDNFGATQVIDPGFTPEQARGEADDTPVHVCSGGVMYCRGQECYDEQQSQPECLDEQQSQSSPTLSEQDIFADQSIHALVMVAYLEAIAPTVESNGEEVIRDIYTDEQIQCIHRATQHNPSFQAPPSDDVWFQQAESYTDNTMLQPHPYDRDVIHLSAGQLKASRVPTRPTKETPEDPELAVDETEFLDPDWVPLPHIAELNETLYTSEVLRELQKKEEAAIKADPNRRVTLEAEIE